MTFAPRATNLLVAVLLAIFTSFTSAAQSEPAAKVAARSIEDIKGVFDAKKGQIFATYNRFLKDNPSLSGRVVLELHIAPSGIVTECLTVANETNSKEFQEALVDEVRRFEFGARDVAPMVAKFPIEFLPR